MPFLPFNLKSRVSHLRLYHHIWIVLTKYGFEELAATIGVHLPWRRRHARPGPRLREGPSRPQRARMVLEELGPIFVKFGQLLSTRPDLIPVEYAAELEQLQDRVPPAPFELVRAEIESQLGAPVAKRFRQFDPVAFAAGSIAQIHRAVTAEGDSVAVKVRRPGIVEAIRTECEVLDGLAALVKSGLARDESTDPVVIVREFTRAVTREVDLTNERRNLQRFGRNFKDDPTVHVPNVYDAYCSQGVLTMEYLDGVKPTNAEEIRKAGLDPKLIAQRGVRFVLRQIFDFGCFQADPHPGNFLALPGSVLAPLDFGQIARLGDAERYLMGEFLQSILDASPQRLILAFQRAEMLGDDADVSQLSHDLRELLEMYAELPVKEMPFGAMMMRTFELFRRHRLRPPAEFSLMLKAMMTIEALALALDSDLRLADELRPYAQRLTLEQASPRRVWRRSRQALADALRLALDLPADLQLILRNFKRGTLRIHVQHEHLESLVRTIDKGSDRLSFALIIAGLLVGSSQLVTQREGNFAGLMSLQTLGVLGYVVAAILGIWLIVSILRSKP